MVPSFSPPLSPLLFSSSSPPLFLSLLSFGTNTVLFYIYFFKLQLIYNVVLISAIHQSDSVINIYTFFYLYQLPLCSITSDWIQFPVLYSRTSLLIHSKCNSLHLLTPNSQSILPLFFLFFLFFFFCLFFAFSRAAPAAYGGFQARGLIGAIATSLHQNHSNAGSEPRLLPTPQLTATPDP